MAATDMLVEILRLPIGERAKLALELLRSLDGESDPDAAKAWTPRSNAVAPRLTPASRTR